jgi:hypothetical protein
MPVEGPGNELVKNRMPQVPIPLFMQSITNYVSTRQCSVRACGIMWLQKFVGFDPPPLVFHASISQ